MDHSLIVDLCKSDEEFTNEHLRGQNFDEFISSYDYPMIDIRLMDMSNFQTNNEFVSSPLHVPNKFQVNNGFVDNSSHDSPPIVRQFWKAGEYDASVNHNAFTQNGCNRLRVHPKFLHSNATSHKWVFGAVAEILDNAVDEVQNGASFVTVDKITNVKNGNPALLIQDDGGGMDPESLRRCMSFGFSDKLSDNYIGQYGNGFKTSTMRLGADVIVFSQHCLNKRNITQSVGLLSYTFLKQTNCSDIIVPMVCYHIDPLTGEKKPLMRHGETQFQSNMSTLLNWSPFPTEAILLNQLNDIGDHGTKVIVFNLWFNDDGDMELDFDADQKDIMISGAPKVEKTKSTKKMVDQSHIGTRYHYSLRVYLSILYLHLPTTFRIILRGQVVEPHHIVDDLLFLECIKYNPQGGDKEQPIITTIGFLEGSPQISVHGFNIYHKNRLILPFWSAFTRENTRCTGIAGVLEVNYLKPTHNKQDFEKSNIFMKLETRLREMALEYWDCHCDLLKYSEIGVIKKRDQKNKKGASKFVEKEHSWSVGDNSPIEFSKKRKHGDRDNLDTMKSPQMSQLHGKSTVELGSNQNNNFGVEHEVKGSEIRRQKLIAVENKKLQTECLVFEETEKELLLKVKLLREELELINKCNSDFVAKLKSLDKCKE